MVKSDIAIGLDFTAEIVTKVVEALNQLESHWVPTPQTKSLWDGIKQNLYSIQKSLKENFEQLQEDESALEEMESATQEVLTEREAMVAEKELALINRLQEVKDFAVSAVLEACNKYKLTDPDQCDAADIKDIEDNEVSSYNDDVPAECIPSIEEENPECKPGEFGKSVEVELMTCYELKQLCEQMDANGLLKYVTNNRSCNTTFPKELSLALKCAPEPTCLVLDCLDGFYPPESLNSLGRRQRKTHNVLRRSCLFLMESAATMLGMAQSGSDDHYVCSEYKQQAKAIADIWKAKLAHTKSTLEAQAFLQLLVTFGIVSEFDVGELCMLLLTFPKLRQQAELFQSLGLADKLPGVVRALVKSGKQVDAVNLIHAFQVTGSCSPVPLLKAYLNAARKKSQKKTQKNGAQQDANNEELGALRTVIRCIKQYKLQNEYPMKPLWKMVSRLENEKVKMKKSLIEADKRKENNAKKRRLSGEQNTSKPSPLAASNLQFQYKNRVSAYGVTASYAPYFQQTSNFGP